MFKPIVKASFFGFIVCWAAWLGVQDKAMAMQIQRMDSDVFVSGDIVVNDDLVCVQSLSQRRSSG